MLKKYGSDQITVDAGITGLKGQEADALDQLLGRCQRQCRCRGDAGRAAAKSRDAAQMEKLIAAATSAQQPAKLRLAVLNGANTGLIGADAAANSARLLAAVPAAWATCSCGPRRP